MIMVDAQTLERNRNEDKMSRMVVDLQKRLSKIMEGGGKARQEKEREGKDDGERTDCLFIG